MLCAAFPVKSDWHRHPFEFEPLLPGLLEPRSSPVAVVHPQKNTGQVGSQSRVMISRPSNLTKHARRKGYVD